MEWKDGVQGIVAIVAWHGLEPREESWEEGRMVDGFHGTSFVDNRMELLQKDGEKRKDEEFLQKDGGENQKEENRKEENRKEESRGDEGTNQLEEACFQVWDGGHRIDSEEGVEPHCQQTQLQEKKQ